MPPGSAEKYTIPVFQQNPHLFTDQDGSMIWCKTCDKEYKSRQGAGTHSIKAHNMSIYGNVIKPENAPSPGPTGPKTSTSESSGPSQDETELDITIYETDDANTRAIKEELQRRRQNPNAVDEMDPNNITQAVHAENSKDIASKAVQLVTDIDLMFLYHKTKRMFPVEYDFADFVRSCVVFTMNQCRIKVNIHQDMRGLDDNMVKYFLQVNNEWLEWDKKNGRANGPGEKVT